MLSRYILPLCLSLAVVFNFSASNANAQSQTAPVFYKTTKPVTFLYDTIQFKNWSAYLDPNLSLAICEKTETYFKTCSSGQLPYYYLKPDSGIETLGSKTLPAITKMFAKDNYIDIAYVGSPIPPAFIVNSNKPQLEITFLNVYARNEYTRYDASWTYPRFDFSPFGTNAAKLSISHSPICGIEMQKPMDNVMRFVLKNCSTDSFKVAIDPGHGGTDTGTCYDNKCEKDLTVTLSNKLISSLQKKGILAVATRTDDSTVSLEERVLIAKRENASLLISLHFDNWTPSNYFKSPPTGSSCYFFHEFLSLSSDVICKETGIGGLQLNALSQRGFYVLHSHELPSVLLEVANFASPNDREIILQPEYLEKAAQSLAERIKDLANSMQGSLSASSEN